MADNNLAVRIVIAAVDQASRIFDAIKVKWLALGAALSVAIGFKGLGSTVSTAADFEAALDLIQSKTAANTEEMARFEAAALKAGRDTAFTATQAAEALAVLGAAGLNANDSIATLSSVLALASSEGIALEQAAGLITDAVTVMGLSFQDSARATDVMVAAANLSSVSATQMGESLKYAGAAAKIAGLSLEQTGAVLDVLASNGLRGEQAGTALRGILAQLGDPAGAARRELDKLGISTGDLTTVVDGLKTAGPAAGAAISAFGVEVGPALQALITGGSAAIGDYTVKLQNAGGAAQTAAGVMRDNLTGALGGLGSAWDALTITLSKPLLEPIKQAVVDLTERFRTAASDGSLTAFSTVLVNGFNAVVTAAKTFFAEADLAGFAARFSAALGEMQRGLSTLSAGVTAATNTFKVVWNAVYQSVALVGAGLAVVFSKILTGAAIVAAGLERIGAVSDGTAASIRIHAGAMAESARAMKEASVSAYNDMVAAGGQVGTALGDIVKTSATVAPAMVKAFADGTAAADAQTAALVDAEAQLRAFIQAEQAQAAAAQASAVALHQAEETKQAALQATLRELDTLKERYQTLLAGGDLEGAAGALRQIEALRQGLAQTATVAQSTASAIAEAFQRQGVVSQAALKELANTARRDFEAIRASGTAAPQDLQAMFLAYAEKAIAANHGVADAALKAQAALYQVQIQSTAKGDEATAQNQRLAGSLDRVAGSADQAAGAQQRLNAAQRDGESGIDRLQGKFARLGGDMDDASAATARNASVSHTWAESLALTAQWAGVAIDAIGEYTAEAEKAYAAAHQANQATNDYMMGLIYNGRSMGPVMASVGDGFKRIAREEVEAAVQAANLARAYDAMQSQVSTLQDQFDRGDLGLSAYASRLQGLISANHALGQEKLQPLRDALREAKEQMQDFTDASRDGLRQLQIEWAQLNNRQADVENLEYQKDRIDLEAQIAEAQRNGNAAALAALQQQLALLAQIHAKKLADLKTEAAASKQTGAGGASAATSTASAPTGMTSTAPAPTGNTAPAGAFNTTINIAGVLDVNDRITLASLGRKLQPVLSDLQRRGA